MTLSVRHDAKTPLQLTLLSTTTVQYDKHMRRRGN